jgi:hypothetical protein
MISPYTLYSFMIGGFISLIYCVVIVCLGLFVKVPNNSLFPEIDFSSKVAVGDKFASSYSYSSLVANMSNADSFEVTRRLESSRFYLRFSNDMRSEVEGNRPIVITLQENGLMLGNKATMI